MGRQTGTLCIKQVKNVFLLFFLSVWYLDGVVQESFTPAERGHVVRVRRVPQRRDGGPFTLNYTATGWPSGGALVE